MNRNRFTAIIGSFIALSLVTGGCPDLSELEEINIDLGDIATSIGNEVDVIQTQDPNTIILPDDLDDEIIISDDVTIIDDIETDIIITELPDATLLGLENVTGFDGYYRFLADGVLQGVFVFDGETLLLDFPCLSDIELLSEEYFDPFSGELVDAFDDTGVIFTNPFDFECGDAFIITFDVDGIFAGVDITLIP